MKTDKRKNSIIGSICLIWLVGLCLCGCGSADTASEVSKETDSVKEETKIALTTPEPVATEIPKPTATPSPTKEPWTTPVPKAEFVLSGNPKDEYVLTQPEYIETEDWVMFMDTGTKLYGDTKELMETIFMLVEKETGLSPDARAEYGYLSNEGPSKRFGALTFAGVDVGRKKFHIYVVPFEKSVPMAGHGYMILNPQDLEIAQGEGYAIVHEYTHCLQALNGPWMGTILDEGYSTYITGQITGKDEIIPFNYDSDYNMSLYSVQITKENAEQIFLEKPKDSYDDYLYGYRFMTFLMENYGEDIFGKLLAEALLIVDEDWNELSREEAAMCVKKYTSDTVFEEFGDWMTVNKKRFEG